MKVGITSSLDVVSPSFQSCAKARHPDKATTSINLLRVSRIVVTTPPSGQKQTSSDLESMSALPPKADMCSATAHVCYGPEADIRVASFDYLVGAGEQRWWDSEPKRLRRLDVDDERELRRVLHRQVGGVGAIEDAINVRGCLAHLVSAVGSIRNQSALTSKNGIFINCRQSVASQQRDN